jgi:hypothetical protein
MVSDRNERIQARAYAIWIAENRPHGKDEEHWHRAAREIDEEDRLHEAPGRRAPATRGSAAPARPARVTNAGKSGDAEAPPQAAAKKTGGVKPRRGSGAAAS